MGLEGGHSLKQYFSNFNVLTSRLGSLLKCRFPLRAIAVVRRDITGGGGTWAWGPGTFSLVGSWGGQRCVC